MPDDIRPTQDLKRMANAIRALSFDAVEAAKSGHPGMPMGMADVATVLFARVLTFNPAEPDWPDRDRFVLSAGHGSMLLYALGYLLGYARPTLEDIRHFRQLHSPCAGHPEYGEAPGIETTTGPLGQGLATAVGMAIAERLEAARSGDEICDHYTYVIAGDGCLMEGISHEAASLAGHLKLGKLIVLFDDNGISIDGPTSLATSDDHGARFAAYGWHTDAIDGHDPEAIATALAAAKADPRPSLIACKTHIGFGAPTKQDSAAAHGAPLGADEIAGARAALDWPYEPFDIPSSLLEAWRMAGTRGAVAYGDWKLRYDRLSPAAKAEFERRQAGQLPPDFATAITGFVDQLVADAPKLATRKASQNALEVINDVVPEMIGGSADLTGSNNTKTAGLGIVTADDFAGRYLHYGVREFAMAAAMNGIALHGGFIPYGGTFLVFTDYARGAIRLSALMRQRVIYVMTHDSIGLGEDGPTHQPIEHLMSLRAMPNLNVFRPCDAVETAECWAAALAAAATPSVIALSRQGLPALRAGAAGENLAARGGYVLADAADGAPEVTILATGSEVATAIEAKAELDRAGLATRVVSLPCWELFEAQDAAYREATLGSARLMVSIEAGSTLGWERYVGRDGLRIGIDGFGASAPAVHLFEHFGLTAGQIVAAIKARF